MAIFNSFLLVITRPGILRQHKPGKVVDVEIDETRIPSGPPELGVLAEKWQNLWTIVVEQNHQIVINVWLAFVDKIW